LVRVRVLLNVRVAESYLEMGRYNLVSEPTLAVTQTCACVLRGEVPGRLPQCVRVCCRRGRRVL
jgi:hypothetical protein